MKNFLSVCRGIAETLKKKLYSSVGKKLAGEVFALRVTPHSGSSYYRFNDVLSAVENQVNRVSFQSVMIIIEQVYVQNGLANTPILPDQNTPTYENPATHKTIMVDIRDRLPSFFTTLSIDKSQENLDAMKAVTTNRELVDVIINSVLKLG